MATGRIGVTPTLGVRWSKAPAGGTTSLSGLDDNSVSLVYSVGYEQVYRNGVLLSRGNDYTATDGTTVTLIDATLAGDIIEVFAQELVPLTDAISKGQFNAKGALLSATAAATPGVLAVGANDTVLTADSSTATGLKWATPSAGGMTLISTTTLTGASVTLSSIPQTYVSLYLVVTGVTGNTSDAQVRISPNNVSNLTNYSFIESGTANSVSNNRIRLTDGSTLRTSADNAWAVQIDNYTSSTTFKPFSCSGLFLNASSVNASMLSGGAFRSNTAITSLVFDYGGTNTFAGGTVLLYGVK
jgi:hypothetical protein